MIKEKLDQRMPVSTKPWMGERLFALQKCDDDLKVEKFNQKSLLKFQGVIPAEQSLNKHIYIHYT